MIEYPYILAFGEITGAPKKAVDAMVKRARESASSSAKVCWFFEGSGWFHLSEIRSESLHNQIEACVLARGGRSDEYLRSVEILQASEILRHGDWAKYLCFSMGWDDPGSIEHAAETTMDGGIRVVVLQTTTGVEIYWVHPDGEQYVTGPLQRTA